jgi:preprotein translocase subunit SecF
MVNLSMNQTLARSINTSLVAVIPVLSVLVIGSYLLGATSLQSFGLALVIGLISGAYSSIFIASPLLAMLKERESRYITIRQRLETRGEGRYLLTPAAAAVMAGTASGRKGGSLANQASDPGVIRPGARTNAGPPTKASQGIQKAPIKKAATQPASGSSATRPTGGGARPAPRPRKRKPGAKRKRR